MNKNVKSRTHLLLSSLVNCLHLNNLDTSLSNDIQNV